MVGMDAKRWLVSVFYFGITAAIGVSAASQCLAQSQAGRPVTDGSDRGTAELLSGHGEQSIARAGLKPLATQLPDTKLLPGLLPPDASQGLIGDRTRPDSIDRGVDWQPLCYHWKASNLRHRPLYFEDAMLERNGQMYHPLVQPLASGARFFLTFPTLPYTMTVNPPRPAIRTLGYFRPGSCAPALLQRPPLQADAGLMEAGAWIGLIFLVP